jgi:hypothetical protein
VRSSKCFVHLRSGDTLTVRNKCTLRPGESGDDRNAYMQHEHTSAYRGVRLSCRARVPRSRRSCARARPPTHAVHTLTLTHAHTHTALCAPCVAGCDRVCTGRCAASRRRAASSRDCAATCCRATPAACTHVTHQHMHRTQRAFHCSNTLHNKTVRITLFMRAYICSRMASSTISISLRSVLCVRTRTS